MREILHVGRIGAPHGLRGEVKVHPLTDDITRFKTLKDCYIVSQDEKNRTPALTIGVRFINDLVLLKLEGYEDRDSVEKIKGMFVSVDREHAVKLPEDTWFICDLIGCEIYDQEHGLLGVLSEIIQQSAHDVYIVKNKSEKDLLIPVLKTIVQKVDIDNRRIDVELPAGLYEIYRGQE